ncbi:hypothetical protein K3181_10490 [Qipengyuania sp. YG27]|uniref:Uncharacterized protein n=1 Tax=Qipengyuania mesophila TaxID=2867246 RepID=A0ABS7JWB8_9SPHN|nr:hypothetical protein [Qipengyuania mesophila]MBX7501869.1 hypothetical protein [Qipengyuania mesophila]
MTKHFALFSADLRLASGLDIVVMSEAGNQLPEADGPKPAPFQQVGNAPSCRTFRLSQTMPESGQAALPWLCAPPMSDYGWFADILVDRIMTRHCVDPGTTGAIYP